MGESPIKGIESALTAFREPRFFPAVERGLAVVQNRGLGFRIGLILGEMFE